MHQLFIQITKKHWEIECYQRTLNQIQNIIFGFFIIQFIYFIIYIPTWDHRPFLQYSVSTFHFPTLIFYSLCLFPSKLNDYIQCNNKLCEFKQSSNDQMNPNNWSFTHQSTFSQDANLWQVIRILNFGPRQLKIFHRLPILTEKFDSFLFFNLLKDNFYKLYQNKWRWSTINIRKTSTQINPKGLDFRESHVWEFRDLIFNEMNFDEPWKNNTFKKAAHFNSNNFKQR